MKLKTQLPLFTMTLAAASMLCGPVLLPSKASGQSVPATPSMPSAGQEWLQTPGQAESKGDLGGAEILSDTRGVNFSPYLKGILSEIYGRWTGLLPEEARKPTLAKGETDIRFTISPDGKITAMHLDASTHDTQLNLAAWGAITGAQHYPPLPAAFTGPNLELRVHFRVNLEDPGGKS